MDSLQQGDAEAAAVQKTPNRVALADIEAAIGLTLYGTARDMADYLVAQPHGQVDGLEFAGDVEVPAMLASLETLTICILVMRNGFNVIGKSAPADPTNFNRELGRKFAREDAIRQLWPHMGFALRDRLYREQDKQPSQELDFRTGKPYPVRDKLPG